MEGACSSEAREKENRRKNRRKRIKMNLLQKLFNFGVVLMLCNINSFPIVVA
jgi:predicted nucleic acid-binding Zn ribbon protein